MSDKLQTLADILPLPSHAEHSVTLEFGDNPLPIIYAGRVLNVTDITVHSYYKDFTTVTLMYFELNPEDQSMLVNMISGVDPEEIILYNGSEAQKVLYVHEDT